MDTAKLTPVERGVLFILRGEGRPLRENAEIKGIYGLTMRKAHRERLQECGLIKSSPAPFVHSLTRKGEEWVKRRFSSKATIPPREFVPLKAVLAVITQPLAQLGVQIETLFERRKSSGNGLTKHIATAAWSEADEALGEALQEIPLFYQAMESLKAASGDVHAEETKQVQLAANLIFQLIQHAARKRELRLGSDRGADAVFDPVKYYSDDNLSHGEPVRVVKPPVIRGQGSSSVVVRVGEAAAIEK